MKNTDSLILADLKESVYLNSSPATQSLDLILKLSKAIKQAKALELTFFVYPYSKELNEESFSILPYEEYIADVVAGRRSTYQKIRPFGNKLFGIILGFLIASLFYIFNPSELYSLQSLVAVLGAYTLGKEMWGDMDSFLVDISKKSNFRWRDIPYFYQKEDFGTIQRFWRLARFKRNKQFTILPIYLDFITQSNSKTVELYFENETLNRYEAGTSLNFGRVEYKEEAYSKVIEAKSMYGFKMSLRQKHLLFDITYELFQACDSDEIGTIDKTGIWEKEAVLYRKVLNIGRFRYYISKEILKNFKLITLT